MSKQRICDFCMKPVSEMNGYYSFKKRVKLRKRVLVGGYGDDSPFLSSRKIDMCNTHFKNLIRGLGGCNE